MQVNIEYLFLRQLADFLDILKQRLPRSDALLRYRFFYRGSNGCRLQEVQRLFLQHCTPFDLRIFSRTPCKPERSVV